MKNKAENQQENRAADTDVDGAKLKTAATPFVAPVFNVLAFAARALGQALGGEMLFALQGAGGKRWFTSVPFRRRQARSKTAPSLYLTNVDCGEPLIGHVEAYYWALNPWKHGLEFFLKQTEPPSVLLKLCARGR